MHHCARASSIEGTGSHAEHAVFTHLAELERLGLLLLTQLGIALPLLQKRLGHEHLLGAGHSTGGRSVSCSVLCRGGANGATEWLLRQRWTMVLSGCFPHRPALTAVARAVPRPYHPRTPIVHLRLDRCSSRHLDESHQRASVDATDVVRTEKSSQPRSLKRAATALGAAANSSRGECSFSHVIQHQRLHQDPRRHGRRPLAGVNA